MLVLTRKRGEQIRIGDNIVVRVERISEDRVRISVHAPKNISVDREEVHAAKRKEIIS